MNSYWNQIIRNSKNNESSIPTLFLPIIASKQQQEVFSIKKIVHSDKTGITGYCNLARNTKKTWPKVARAIEAVSHCKITNGNELQYHGYFVISR